MQLQGEMARVGPWALGGWGAGRHEKQLRGRSIWREGLGGSPQNIEGGDLESRKLGSNSSFRFCQLDDLEQDTETSAKGRRQPGLRTGQGALNEVIGVMAFHTELGRE